MSVEEIMAIATEGYPPGATTPLWVSQHGDHAAVLLETGSAGYSLPYFTLCRREDGQWAGVQASNMPGWYQTEDDAGVVVFWDDAEGLPEPIEVEFEGQRWKADTGGVTCWAICWDELNPANYIDPLWPSLAR